MNLPTPRRLAVLVALAIAYFVAAKFGLGLAFVNASATAVWAPTGITLAAFLVLGLDVWPAILLGAFLANLTTQGSVLTSVSIGIGNTLEGLLGAILVNRFAHGRAFVASPRDLVAFTILAAIVSTTVSATIGLATLALAGFAQPSDFAPIWLTWWLGDASGDLLVAPALVLWSSTPRMHWSGRWLLEAGALCVGLTLVALIVFAGVLPAIALRHLPLEFLCVPFLVWAAFRLGRRAVATCILILACISISGTLHGAGPFARDSSNGSLLLLQAYLAVEAVTMLALAAVVSERRRAEEKSRQLAVNDELTGLANFRRLMQVLEGELRRSERLAQPFAVLLLDMDGMKRVNDLHGHLVGNRALCRVADCLRAACRAVDTPARFGGDEFAIVLPGASAGGAGHVASRIVSRLAGDDEQPRLTASIGIAVYPHDGATAEVLLRRADRALYQSKGAAHTELESKRRLES